MNAKLFTASTLALLLSSPVCAHAQDATAPATPPATNAPSSTMAGTDSLQAADRSFVDEALKSGETEVQAAQLAQQRAVDGDVRELAEEIERDHRDLNAKLLAAGARSATIERQSAPATTPATTPGTRSADSGNAVGGAGATDSLVDDATGTLSADPHMKPLLSARGADFDQAYLDMLVQMHRKSIAKFEAVANGNGHSAEVRSLAQQALPGLRRHASMAESLDKAVAQQ